MLHTHPKLDSFYLFSELHSQYFTMTKHFEYLIHTILRPLTYTYCTFGSYYSLESSLALSFKLAASSFFSRLLNV